jgi:beta-glucosidase
MDKLMVIKMVVRVFLSTALCVALLPLTAFSYVELSAAERPSDRLSLKGKDGRLWWRELYEEQLDCIRKSNGRFDFVLIGDSITSNWRRKDGRSYFGGTRRIGKNVADEFFSEYKWLNAGIGGDGTPQVLWRCLNGILDGYEARVISLMVGTNNRRESAVDVALGIKRILEIIRIKQPQAKILLNPILPRFVREDDPGDMNAKNEKTNIIIQGYCDGNKIIWLDWREGLYKNGILDKAFWYDREHPAEGGYRLWAKALMPHISSLAPPVSPIPSLSSANEK